MLKNNLFNAVLVLLFCLTGTCLQSQNTEELTSEDTILVSNHQLQAYLITLERLWRGSSSTKKRNQVTLRDVVVRAYFRTALLSVGEDSAYRYYSEKATLAEVQRMARRCPSPLLKKYSIEDIEDRKVVSESELLRIVEVFRQSYEDIIKITGDEKYFFRQNGEGYYRLPVSLLP